MSKKPPLYYPTCHPVAGSKESRVGKEARGVGRNERLRRCDQCQKGKGSEEGRRRKVKKEGKRPKKAQGLPSGLGLYFVDIDWAAANPA